MANIIEGLFHTVEVSSRRIACWSLASQPSCSRANQQGLIQSILAVIQSFLTLIYSVFHGLFAFFWGVLESIAGVVGASANFVLCESFGKLLGREADPDSQLCRSGDTRSRIYRIPEQQKVGDCVEQPEEEGTVGRRILPEKDALIESIM